MKNSQLSNVIAGWLFFSISKVCIINNYLYLCSARTRQASQRCSNVRVVFVYNTFILKIC